jgi:hypothetical protein
LGWEHFYWEELRGNAARAALGTLASFGRFSLTMFPAAALVITFLSVRFLGGRWPDTLNLAEVILLIANLILGVGIFPLVIQINEIQGRQPDRQPSKSAAASGDATN